MTTQRGRNLTPAEAGAMLGVSAQFVRCALQRDALPIGTAVKINKHYSYVIPENAVRRFIEYGGGIAKLKKVQEIEEV